MYFPVLVFVGSVCPRSDLGYFLGLRLVLYRRCADWDYFVSGLSDFPNGSAVSGRWSADSGWVDCDVCALVLRLAWSVLVRSL